MLVRQDTPCPDCGHPRRDHELRSGSFGSEQCAQCDCVVGIPYTVIPWDPDAAPQPLDWSSVIDLLVLFVKMGGSFADIAPSARPRYALRPGEIDDLRIVEGIIRDLWSKYSPKRPEFDASVRNIAAENAAVDGYEAEKDQLQQVLFNLCVTDEWRSRFPFSEHANIQRALEIIKAWSRKTPPDSAC